GVRRKGEEKIIAGFVATDVPEAKQSKHFISFLHPEAKRAPVGTGLMDVWFERALANGTKHLDFGVFRAPGDPSSWEGFSKFKGQFGIFFIRYPYPLVRTAGTFRELLRHLFGLAKRKPSR